MPEVVEYSWGTPSWAELDTPDIEVSRSFYAEVFGWGSYVLTTDRLGDYEMLTLDGSDGPEVAGLSQLADPFEAATWMFFFQTHDLETALKRATEAGGQVLLSGADVGDLGRMGTAQDLEGLEFGYWQPYRHQGAARIDEPGALSWIELATTDLEAAAGFYAHAMDWRVTSLSRAFPADRLEWAADSGPVASAVPTEGPPHWRPYLGVADCEAAMTRAERAGGRIVLDPAQGPEGLSCIIADPHGAEIVLVCRGG